MEEFVHYESRPRKNGNQDLTLKILGSLHFVTTPSIHFFSLYIVSDITLFILGLVAWGQAANSHLHKLLRLQKRALHLIYFFNTREHAVPLSISSNLLPLNMLYFETVSTLMHGYKTRSCNSSIFQKRINNFISLFSFAYLEKNTYIHKIISGRKITAV